MCTYPSFSPQSLLFAFETGWLCHALCWLCSQEERNEYHAQGAFCDRVTSQRHCKCNNPPGPVAYLCFVVVVDLHFHLHIQNFLDACCASIAFYGVGYAFAFGETEETGVTFVGTKNFFLMGEVDQAFWFFQFAFSATAVTIVAGTLVSLVLWATTTAAAVQKKRVCHDTGRHKVVVSCFCFCDILLPQAERCQMAAYLCYSAFLTGFVYPVVVHAVWSSNGFLSAFTAEPYRGIGVIDFAGSGVVHTTGGATALIATYILGARKGRFHDSRGRPLEKPREIQGHSVALQLMGTMVLWFGCKLALEVSCWFDICSVHGLTLFSGNYLQGTVSTLARPFS